mgnify:CR=1 FL=1
MLICGIEPKLDRTKKCQLRNVDREAKERGMAKNKKRGARSVRRPRFTERAYEKHRNLMLGTLGVGRLPFTDMLLRWAADFPAVIRSEITILQATPGNNGQHHSLTHLFHSSTFRVRESYCWGLPTTRAPEVDPVTKTR